MCHYHRLLMIIIVCGLFSFAPIQVWGQVELPSVDAARGRLGPLNYPRVAMDPAGGTIRMEAPPQRIVSLHTNTDEYLYAVIPPELIVGVHSSAYDRQFSRLPELIAPYNPAIASDTATIVNLKPDLVIGTPSSNGDLMGSLEAVGVPVFRLETLVTRLEQVAENITVLGYITGQDERAHASRAQFEADVAEIAEQCSIQHPEARIFGHSMTGFSYGDQTLFHDVVRLVGGLNVAAEGGLHTYERITYERVMEWNPDWVFTWAEPGQEAEELRRWIEDPYLSQTVAAEKEQIVVADGRDTRRLSPFILTRARAIADAVCPGSD